MSRKNVDIAGQVANSFNIGGGLDSIFNADTNNQSTLTNDSNDSNLKELKSKQTNESNSKEETELHENDSNKGEPNQQNNSFRESSENNPPKSIQDTDESFYKKVRPGRKSKLNRSTSNEFDVLAGLVQPKENLERLVTYVFEEQRIFVAAMAIQYKVSESEIVRLALKQAINVFAKKANVPIDSLINWSKEILQEAAE